MSDLIPDRESAVGWIVVALIVLAIALSGVVSYLNP
jgi:hypothetical protein